MTAGGPAGRAGGDEARTRRGDALAAGGAGGRTGGAEAPPRRGDANATRGAAGRPLVEAAARRYDGAGPATRQFVRGKLRGDPIYLELLAGGDLPRRGRLLDLGCGQGIALALLAAARGGGRGESDAGGGDGGVEWPAGWPPPADLELIGIERSPRRVAVARASLGGEAEVRQGDLAGADLPPCDAVLLLDVLHYLSAADQTALVGRAARALAPGGVLLIREADAARGMRFALTRVQERLAALARGHWRQHFHYRPGADWRRLLAACGFETEARPMWRGTPFANVLIVGRKPAVRGKPRAAGGVT